MLAGRMREPVTTHLPVSSADWTLQTDLRCTHDLEGRLLSVSAAAARALGYNVEDLLKIPIRDLVAAEWTECGSTGIRFMKERAVPSSWERRAT